MVSEGQFVGLDWNRIARLHSQVLVSTCENSLTATMFGTPLESKYKPLFSPLHIYISLQEQMPFQLLTSK